jgi:hypothetical protein
MLSYGTFADVVGLILNTPGDFDIILGASNSVG